MKSLRCSLCLVDNVFPIMSPRFKSFFSSKFAYAVKLLMKPVRAVVQVGPSVVQ